MARPGATHRAAAPSCTPATRDRTGRLHRDVHGRPAACPNPGLLDVSGLASASRPRIARGPQAPGRQPCHPGARSSSPAASGRPGRAPVHPLRRDPRSAPPPRGRSPSGMHLRTEVPVPWRPGRPCRRQKRAFAASAALHKYTVWPTGHDSDCSAADDVGTSNNRALSRRYGRFRRSVGGAWRARRTGRFGRFCYGWAPRLLGLREVALRS